MNTPSADRPADTKLPSIHKPIAHSGLALSQESKAQAI